MARRVIYRDNSLVFGNPPNGYKFVGYNGVTFSQLDFSGNVTPIGGGSGGGIGPGTVNYIPKWSSSSTLSSTSNIYDTGVNVGIGTASPIYPFHVVSTTGSFYFRPGSTGLVTEVFGNSKITQLSVQTAAYLTYSSCGISIGTRAWDDLSFSGYGKKGDSFIYSSAASNGLNIISQDGTSTDDYIRFYAGRDAASTPDIHITGGGTTRGYVGIGTTNPQSKLQISGTVSTTDLIVDNKATLDGAIVTTGIVSTTGVTSPSITGASVWRVKFSSSPGVEVTLPNGVNGQRLTVYCYDESLGGSVTVTPTTAANFTSFNLTTMGQSVDLIYDSTIGWVIIGTRGIGIDNISPVDVS